MKPVLLVSVLALAAANAAVAQTPHNGAYVGGGFEAAGAGASYERAWGVSLQAGFVRQYRRAGLRIGSTYYQRNRQRTFTQDRVVGLNLEVTYDVATSRFRPYLIGGWGLCRRWGHTSYSSYYELQTFDLLSPTMIAGLGLRYRFNNIEMFAELRGHWMTSHSYWAGPFAPVTFGLKFN